MALETAGLNAIDLGVLGIVILSGFVAVLRGFTREFLGILAWALAIFVTFWGMPILKPFVRDWVGNKLIADILSGLFLFVVSLGAFMALIRTVSGSIKKSILGGLDRALGLLFGIVRGGILCICAFMASNFVWKPDVRPPLLTTARVYPFLIQGTEGLAHLLPPGTIPPRLYEDAALMQQLALSPEELMYRLSKPKVDTGDSKPDSNPGGYGADSRRDMERLFHNAAED